VSFPVRRAEDLETGCGALFERSMVPVQRLLDSLGKFGFLNLPVWRSTATFMGSGGFPFVWLTECLSLRCAEMSKDTIDEVVLVGGTTRIPKVKQQLRCVQIGTVVPPVGLVWFGSTVHLDLSCPLVLRGADFVCVPTQCTCAFVHLYELPQLVLPLV
jgi:hypothetical protein